MEGRGRKYGRTSPERSRVRAEPPPPKHQHHHHPHQPQRQQQHQGRRLPVVYYVCRNRHLEHPHFIEVPTSSPEGLYLRDVINRLNVLRGKGMAAMYSWSCKRSYKNGFVWHDLSEDDLILPANGSEYVLKGSELLDASPSDRSHHNSNNTRSQASNHPQRETPSPSGSRSQEEASPSSSVVVVQGMKAPRLQLPHMPLSPPTPPPPAPFPEDEHSPGLQRQSPSPRNVSPGSNLSPPPGGGSSSPCLAEYQVRRAIGAADASTQTEETEGRSRRARPAPDLCTPGVSTDEGSLDVEAEEGRRTRTPRSKGSSEICEEEISPLTTTSSSASSSGGKLETLESLIRADARRMNSFRILEEEEVLANTGHPKLKATNVLMQLITCGSISVKGHHSFGLVPTYKPSFSHVNFPPPIYSSSRVLGEMDCPAKDSRMMGLRLEGKGYFSGSLVERKKHRECGEVVVPNLKRSSSYNDERICGSPDPTGDKGRVVDSAHSKCHPGTVKTTACKQFRNEAVRSPLSDGPKICSAGLHCNQCMLLDRSMESSKRTDASSVKGSSMRLESFQKDKERVIKIEERLTSGARVIIQSRAPCDDREDISSS